MSLKQCIIELSEFIEKINLTVTFHRIYNLWIIERISFNVKVTCFYVNASGSDCSE